MYQSVVGYRIYVKCVLQCQTVFKMDSELLSWNLRDGSGFCHVKHAI
ncbi:hypothetical protein PSAC2689_180087 [Paraburkholderia sacchari]